MRRCLSTIIFYAALLYVGDLQAQSTEAETKANAIAKACITAMGGAENFAATNYIGWTFFGRRTLIWDKVHDRVRIDYKNKPLTIITSLHNDSTLLFMNDVRITDADSLAKYSEKGKRIWANDSYWLLMPFKLFDEGVHLAYVKDSTINNVETNIIEMTFNNVGFTPENKYLIYIDQLSHLVIQWSYFDKYTDAEPEFTDTWSGYHPYGKILISGERGADGKLEDIYVWEYLPEGVFTKYEMPDLK